MKRPRYNPFPWAQEVVSEKGQSLSGSPNDVSSIGGLSNVVCLSLAYFEMRSILARVLWNFDMQIAKASQGWMEQKEYILWDKPPLWVKLEHKGCAVD